MAISFHPRMLRMLATIKAVTSREALESAAAEEALAEVDEEWDPFEEE